ncbi:hydrogenase assembly protein HupF [Saccharopolyspora shandongensis]|uniref:hydrogenase assembly protein HupF n=1 Tax=Saccharopolyspora shandongensis TaxID=418495 RepID=UPI0033BFDE90
MTAREPAENCTGDRCVTCSDEVVAVEVLRLLDDGLAAVATESGEEVVSVALVSARPGDTVLVHAGESIGIVKE